MVMAMGSTLSTETALFAVPYSYANGIIIDHIKMIISVNH